MISVGSQFTPTGLHICLAHCIGYNYPAFIQIYSLYLGNNYYMVKNAFTLFVQTQPSNSVVSVVDLQSIGW